jgi:hypothetical protein
MWIVNFMKQPASISELWQDGRPNQEKFAILDNGRKNSHR